jgi:hypothetical protein
MSRLWCIDVQLVWDFSVYQCWNLREYPFSVPTSNHLKYDGYLGDLVNITVRLLFDGIKKAQDETIHPFNWRSIDFNHILGNLAVSNDGTIVIHRSGTVCLYMI